VTPVDVVALFEAHGARCDGEPVSQLEHALQCAALAVRDRADDELVVAALLHDIGHLFGAGADAETLHHGHHGARLLRPFVPERVAWLVEHHVVAKRYLCTVDPRYAARLSSTSAQSLLLQGAALPLEERLALETRPWFADALRIRRWDDEAKAPGATVPPLDEYRSVLERWLGPPSRCAPGVRPR
jgi:gamma-butyrobetaine dioxygenase